MGHDPRNVGQVLSDAIAAAHADRTRKSSREVKEVRVLVWREPEGSPYYPKFRGPTVTLDAMRFLWQYASTEDRRTFIKDLVQWLGAVGASEDPADMDPTSTPSGLEPTEKP